MKEVAKKEEQIVEKDLKELSTIRPFLFQGNNEEEGDEESSEYEEEESPDSLDS